MRGKLLFVTGLAAGFVLGSRAGREKYEEIRLNARKLWESPSVQEAAGVAQAQATKLYADGKDKLQSSKIYNDGKDRLHTTADKLHTAAEKRNATTETARIDTVPAPTDSLSGVSGKGTTAL
jgi:hypothetical protein